ncbi:hypothetical protein KC614_03390 [candidate division WWE3 bacterium]|uniref:Uncharacterized protein n=1 Tax=candidate division WWE3 bacterium TaxID=2053526 RepID=A0A955LL51_UNCKA|nr:hypothetical protein [candidate division WWE3 bacterium]
MALLNSGRRFECTPSSPREDEIQKIDFRVLDRDKPELGRIAVQLKSRPMEDQEIAKILSTGIVPLEVIADNLETAIGKDGIIQNEEEAQAILAEITLAIDEYGQFIRSKILSSPREPTNTQLLEFISSVKDKIKELYAKINEQRFGSNGPRVFNPV